MLKYSVCFRQPEDIASFVNATSQFDGDIDLVSGRVIVDAKSVMGVADISKLDSLQMVVHTDDCPELLEKVAPMLV